MGIEIILYVVKHILCCNKHETRGKGKM